MTQKYDAIIIGGGHNGLTCAAYLAKAGRRVLVLEQRHILGGAAVTEEVYPGFKFTVFSYVVSLLRPEVIRELNLAKHGLHLMPLETAFVPMENGNHLALYPDPASNREAIRRHSARDADVYPEFSQMMYDMAFAVKPILGMVPPDPTAPGLDGLRTLLDMVKHAGSLDSKRFYTLTKLMTMSASDFLDEWFETDVLKAVTAINGIIGTYLGPRSPGTAYVLLHHYMGELDGAFTAWGFQKGGTGAVSQAIASAARSFGAEIRCKARVAQVMVKKGQAVGVALDSGEEIYSPVVVSGCDPKVTFMKLLGEEYLPDDLAQAIHNFKFRGSSGKVNLALDGLPTFTAMSDPSLLQGMMEICPSMDYVERAYDDAKYGCFSRRPYLDVTIPTAVDPTMAPPGKHVMSIFVQYAPYHLQGSGGAGEQGGGEPGSLWPSQREAFGDAVVNTLAEFAPNIKDLILHRQVLSPWDMEQMIGLTEGNIFHGELTLDQLFFLRPAPGWANYRTPVKGYWQCGSGTHPGGGITAGPGRLAALEILKDGKR
ncbi:MAG: NAD(P)/FAD-dependent oxidoreductase [Anaerolineae bacterium]|nr:NAD(P)/FAD-dependent oxidoreductase [Anaerolineales bacterium]MCQ3973342.1 amine oxidase [Anaerolineae bacterium]